jgi:hypothetical protein
MQKAHLGGRLICAHLIAAVFILAAACFPPLLRADLRTLSNDEMAAITGTGFTSFLIDGDRIRADFNISAQTYTEIDSFKMGYWDNGGGPGWDQNWTQAKLGTPAQDMSLHGFFIEATFQNLSDPVNRRLTGVYFGFNQVSGDLSANFESLSKIGVNGDPDDQRLNLGVRTFQFNDSEFRISLELDGAHRGIWVRFGQGTTLQ